MKRRQPSDKRVWSGPGGPGGVPARQPGARLNPRPIVKVSEPQEVAEDDMLLIMPLPDADESGLLSLPGSGGGELTVIEHVEQATSNFQREIDDLRKLMGENPAEVRSDAGVLSMYRMMLSATLDMLPVAKTQYDRYKNERAAYAFSTLVNQSRDLANDIRSLQDLEGQVQHILANVMQPAFTLLVQNLINEVYAARRTMLAATKDPKAQQAIQTGMEALMRAQASFMQDILSRTQSQLRDYLVDKK